MRSFTVFEIHGHPDGSSTLDAQGMSRIFDMDYKSGLTLKKVTLINGLADNGGAIRMRSRAATGMSQVATDIHLNEATRLTIRGGAIRDCEATGDGGAIAHLSNDIMFGGAAGEDVLCGLP